MKYTLHVPVEQYGFIQVDDIESRTQAINEYKMIRADFVDVDYHENPGLPEADWKAILDDLLEDQSIDGDPGIVETMNPAQRYVINEIKKSFKRLHA